MSQLQSPPQSEQRSVQEQAELDLASFEDQASKRPKSRNLKPLLGLMPFIGRYRTRVVTAFLALLLAAGATLAVPMAVRRVIDHGFSSDNAGFVDQYFGMMLVVVAALAIGSALRYYFVTWIGERVVADLRDKVFAHLLNLTPSFYEVTRTGEVVARLTADTTQLKSVFGSTISVALRNIVMLVGAVVMMMVTSIKLSGLVLLAIPLIVLPLVLFGRRVRALSRTAQDALAASAALAQESLSATQAIQANSQESRMARAFSQATETSFGAAALRTKARAILTMLIIFIAFGSVVAVLWFGAQDVLAGKLSGGALGQFVLYAALAAGGLGSLSEVWGEIQLAAGAAERLQEILDTPVDISAPANPLKLPQPSPGLVALKNVQFHYPTRPDQAALNGVSLDVKNGETVAIVGPSGAGKTTLFGLISRFYDPQSGQVLLDGVDVAMLNPTLVRERIAAVPQDPVIFSSTILENIRFGRPDANDDEVRAAANAAHATEFIDDLPDGYNTRVGERGTTLSGGQRQRLAIARAILRNAPILLLDEATSALDAESEVLVQKALDELMKNRTTLVIAHRLATVRNADRIIVMDHGQISDIGTHKALSKKGGLYARLAKLQFSDAG